MSMENGGVLSKKRESSEEPSVTVEMFDGELVIELVLEKLKVSEEEQTMEPSPRKL